MTRSSSTPPPPPSTKRGRSKIKTGTLEGHEVVSATTARMNKALIGVCSKCQLPTQIRQAVETIRLDMMRGSDALLSGTFADSMYCTTDTVLTCFVAYVSYWAGKLRTLRLVWENKKVFRASMWKGMDAPINMLEQVAASGFDAKACIISEGQGKRGAGKFRFAMKMEK